jgi:hypothetical protein
LRIRKNSLSKGALLGNPSQGFCRPEHISTNICHESTRFICGYEYELFILMRTRTADDVYTYSPDPPLVPNRESLSKFFLLKLYYSTRKHPKCSAYPRLTNSKGRGAAHNKFESREKKLEKHLLNLFSNILEKMLLYDFAS